MLECHYGIPPGAILVSPYLQKLTFNLPSLEVNIWLHSCPLVDSPLNLSELWPSGSRGDISVYSAYRMAPNKKEAESSLNFKAHLLIVIPYFTGMDPQDRNFFLFYNSWGEEQESSQMTLFTS